MNLKKSLEKRIRGWLPKETQAPSYQLKTNRKPPKTRTQVWIVTFVMGFVGGLLGAFGVSLGLFSGLDMYIWPILIGMVLSIVAAVIVIRKKRRTTKDEPRVENMNPKKYLENRIRGWLPKEPDLPSFPTATSRKNEQGHKIKLPIGRVLIFSLFTVASVGYFSEGNALGALWLWFSCILGLSLALDVLVARGKEFNEKSVAGSLLAIISIGGILANVYIFSAPTSFFTRIFSLSVLVVVHVPLLFAVVAYVWGKKELSKKLIGWFSSRR
jgi:hypothetical protein